jgi:hypothetical protein
MKKIAVMLLPAAVAFGTLACEEDDNTTPMDTSTDTGTDPTMDTGTDPSVDTIPEPTADTIPEPTADTGTDTPTEEGVSGQYGTLSGSFSSGFIFDSSRLSDSDYLSAHMEGIGMSGAFTGSFGSGGVVPPGGAAQTIALAAHIAAAGSSPATVAVIQQSQDMSYNIVNPIVQITFPSDDVADGDYDLNITEADDVMLALFNATGPSSQCVLALGIGGTITVTNAVDTTLTEGGTISVSFTDAPLYHPSSTPMGDITSDLIAQGAEICPVE